MKTKSSTKSKEKEDDEKFDKKWKKIIEKKRAKEGSTIGVLLDAWLDSLVLHEASCIRCCHSPIRYIMGGMFSSGIFGCPKCGHVNDTHI